MRATNRLASQPLVPWCFVMVLLSIGHSRRQTVVATSSAEAENYSLAAGLQEALAARPILQELGETVEIVVKCDSSAARAMANRVVLGRTKHVDVKYLWVQQVIQHRLARVAPVSSNENLSDIGTKTCAK